MSHFTVTVTLPGTLTEDQIPAALEAAMRPFDENLEVPRYVEYTREQLIAKGRAEIEQYRAGRFYQDFIEDPYAYAERQTRNLRHLEYLAGGTAALEGDPVMAEHLHRLRAADVAEWAADPVWTQRASSQIMQRMPYAESFPAKLDWDDEQVYASELRWHEEENLTPEGGVYSERNPQSKWDWYSIGGRWAGYWFVHEKAAPTEDMSDPAWAGRPFLGDSDREYVETRISRPGRWTDIARKYDIDFAASDSEDRGTVATYAFLDSDGKWHEKGEMGWFGIGHGEKQQEEWNAEYDKLTAAESDNAWFVLVDCHI